jgi:ribosomal protein L11 methyltransferase
MPTWKATFSGAQAALESLGVRLTEIRIPPADAISLTRTDDARDDAAAAWRLDAYFCAPPDAAEFHRLADDAGLGAPVVEELPDIDWAAHALAGLGVVRAGRFVVYGSHDADRLPGEPGDVAIRIDANQAFGTGHHPTTCGCLALLDRLAGIAPARILDLGTGSAVLAIAAAKIWDRPVLATDIDAVSVEIARENAALNGAADRVDVVLADGFAHERIRSAAPFDFVFANILAGPLIDFAPAMADAVANRGRVLLAGFLQDQENDVRAAYGAAGFRVINRLDHEAWPVLLFARI